MPNSYAYRKPGQNAYQKSNRFVVHSFYLISTSRFLMEY